MPPVARSAFNAAGGQLAGHVRDEVPHARVLLRPAQLGNRHAAVAANASEIVAHEIDDHHVLRPVLGRTEEAAAARLGAAVALRRALDGRAEHHDAPAPQEELRREARHGERGMAEIGAETRLENDLRRRRTAREARPRNPPRDACRHSPGRRHPSGCARWPATPPGGASRAPGCMQKRAAFELAPLPSATPLPRRCHATRRR